MIVSLGIMGHQETGYPVSLLDRLLPNVVIYCCMGKERACCSDSLKFFFLFGVVLFIKKNSEDNNVCSRSIFDFLVGVKGFFWHSSCLSKP